MFPILWNNGADAAPIYSLPSQFVPDPTSHRLMFDLFSSYAQVLRFHNASVVCRNWNNDMLPFWQKVESSIKGSIHFLMLSIFAQSLNEFQVNTVQYESKAILEFMNIPSDFYYFIPTIDENGTLYVKHKYGYLGRFVR